MPRKDSSRPSANLTAAELEVVRKLYAGDELTNVAIGLRYGQRPNWVNYLATKHGWPLRGKNWRPRIAKPATPEGTKARRPARALRAPSARELAEQRLADEARREEAAYGSGALLAAIRYLRPKFPINREGALIRVGGKLRTEDEVLEIAARERRLEQPEPAMMGVLPGARSVARPAAEVVPPTPKPQPRLAAAPTCTNCGEPRSKWSTALCRACYLAKKPPIAETVALRTPALAVAATPPAGCRCGRPANHYGRCWVRRGMSAPLEKPTAGKPLPRVCEKCGGPRSYWAASLCRACYRANGGPPRTQESRIEALEAEMAALKAELRAHLEMGQGR